MKKNKKILLAIVASILGLILILSLTVAILNKIIEKREAEKEAAGIDYNFYPADFDENIYDDPDFMELMKGDFLSYCDSSTNVTLGITRENAFEQGRDVQFLTDYVYTIIEGDHVAYNACFSDEYFASGKSPKDRFTMQKLHHIVLTKLSEESISEDGVNYTKFVYSVEYCIAENNGTFRNDIGEGSKPQYFVITDRTGTLKIDQVITKR